MLALVALVALVLAIIVPSNSASHFPNGRRPLPHTPMPPCACSALSWRRLKGVFDVRRALEAARAGFTLHPLVLGAIGLTLQVQRGMLLKYEHNF